MYEKGKILKLLGLMIAAALLFIALPATEAMAQGGTTRTVCPDGGGCDFTTIQAAIDAADPGDTINVGAGTYQEELTIGKSVTILGPNAGISPNTGSRVAEAVVAPVNQPGVQDPAVTISNSNIAVVIKGLIFDMSGTTDDSDRFVLSINQHDNILAFEHNIYTGAPETINGYWYITGNNTPATINIIDNYFYANSVSNGIALWGTDQVIDISDNVWEDNQAWAFNLNNVTGVIQDNRVIDLEDDGPEWYENQLGFLFANEMDLDVTGNEFVGLPGTAIRIYDTVNGRLAISENSFTETSSSEYGTIRISDGADLSAVTVEFNRFIDNPVLVQNGSGTQQLDASPNWWGSADGPDPNQIVGDVTYNPWCGNEDCTELVVGPGGSIQSAIDAAADGDTINVMPGTYNEQLYVDKNVNILGAGAGNTIIQSPDTLPVCFTSSAENKAIVCVENAEVQLDGLTIDGLSKGDANYRFIGVAFHNAGGTLSASEVLNIKDTPFSGSQHGNGVYAYNENGVPYTINIWNNRVEGFQKTGIALNAADTTPLTVNVDNNVITGVGPTPTTAQNGIQVWGKLADGVVSNNDISGIYYQNTEGAEKYWVASSILNYYADIEISGNTISGAQYAIYHYAGNGKIDGNVISVDLNEDFYYSEAIFVMNATDVAGELDITNNSISTDDSAIHDYGTYGIDVLSGASDLEVTIAENQVSGFNVGISLYEGSAAGDLTSMMVTRNVLVNNIIGIWPDSLIAAPIIEENHIFGADGLMNDSGFEVDASPNWWGSIGGPTPDQISGADSTVYEPWCGDPECSFTVPDENGVITLSGNVNVPGGIVVNQPGLTFLLQDGTVIQNNSPCFVINADNTKIMTESPLGAVCRPTDGSNGIDVDGDLTNIIIEGLEIDGSNGTNGIHFDGAVTDLVLRQNFIHDGAGDGLFFAAPPAGTVDIQGNLFMDNVGHGINNPAGAADLLAEYNAWGSYDGPAAGDGISTNVDADPWTHVDLYLESSGTDYENKVIQGETITYTVKGNLANVMAADFVLDYPSELSVDGTPAMGDLFDNEALTDDGNQLHFIGYQFGSAALNKDDVVLFTVTFTADSLGKGLELDLIDAPDSFGMSAGTGSSNLIYATKLDDIDDLEVNALPTMDIVPEAGDVVAGLPVEFTVGINNGDGSDYDNLALHLDAPADAILQIWDGAAWVAYVDPFDVGSLAADGTASQLFRVAFFSPGVNTVSAELDDTIAVRTVATASEDFDTLGDFDVTGTVSMQGRSVRSDVPLALTTLTEPDYGVFNTLSVDLISNNYTFSGVNGGDYEFTTNQPRYLNVTADLDKQFSVVSGSVWLEALELKGGNADWADNVIDIGDATIVAGQYQKVTFDNGDVNFDNRVNIQDLALVGGNYNLNSADVYAGWVPLVP